MVRLGREQTHTLPNIRSSELREVPQWPELIGQCREPILQVCPHVRWQAKPSFEFAWVQVDQAKL